MSQVFDIVPGLVYTFEFTNHRNEVGKRIIFARALKWGATPWHTDIQFFLEGFDLEKQEIRQFPLERIKVRSFRRFTDEEVDAFMTKRWQQAMAEGEEKAKADMAQSDADIVGEKNGP